MNVGRSRRPWCYHKRGISLDDDLGQNQEFNELDNGLVNEDIADQSMDEEEVSQDSLQTRFGRLLSCEDMADIHFVVGAPARQLRIPGHRLVLSVGSQVFKLMFYGKQSEEEEILMPDVEPHAFLEFLRHFYSDQINVNKENAVPVLHLAKRFQVSALERRCLQYVRHEIDESNCLAIWLSSKKLKEPEIEELSQKLVERFADCALMSPDFMKADYSSVCELLRNDWLRISELQLFVAVTRWAKSHCLKRGMCPTRANVRLVLNEAIDLIRFPLMSEEDVRGRVASEGLLEDDVVRALLGSHRTWPRQTRPLPFRTSPRAFQRLQSPLLTVQRFQSFDNQLANRRTSSSLGFSASQRVFLAAVGVYGPRKACAFYIQISLSVCRSDRTRDPTIVDRTEAKALLKCDGSQPIINIKLETPFEIEANVFYDVRAQVSATSRPTNQMRAKLNPHLFYSRPQEVHYYYGTGPLLAAKVKKEQNQSLVFNFSPLEDSREELSTVSAPPTPNPPPRPPPPKEYRRPSRIERLKRALSFSDKTSLGEECHVSGGQIPVLLFFA